MHGQQNVKCKVACLLQIVAVTHITKLFQCDRQNVTTSSCISYFRWVLYALWRSYLSKPDNRIYAGHCNTIETDSKMAVFHHRKA